MERLRSEERALGKTESPRIFCPQSSLRNTFQILPVTPDCCALTDNVELAYSGV
jgi:hypothetical protein